MCGIAGFYKLSKVSISSYDTLLNQMQQCIAHRGPDGYGIWFDEQRGIGLAHRRLAIVDPSALGHQPMNTSNGSLVISFNGEIYNHSLLRKKLERLGYTYRSNSDTETILYVYQEWGIEGISKLDGDFSFALYDTIKDEFFLVRDRLGVTPLYFSLQGDIVSFASEIKALWELPWNERKVSPLAMYHYLTFMVSPAPSSIFQGVYKLPAGFYMSIKNKQISFTEWYTPLKQYSLAERKDFFNESFCLENIRTLLINSVKKRMMSDVPFGSFLSGGLDSSLNVALMSNFTDKKVKTFSVAFSDGPEFDELQWARLIADRYGTEHHEIIISEKDAFNFYEKMVYHLDEPLADSVSIPLYFVAQLAKEHGVSVIQSGEGADELFFGYSAYAQYKAIYEKMWQPAQTMLPQAIRKGISYTGSFFAGKQLNKKEFLNNWADNREFFWGGALAFNELQKKKILPSHFFTQELPIDPVIEKIYAGLQQQEFDSYAIVAYHTNVLKQKGYANDFGHKMLYLELKQRIPELLLMRANKMSMAAGVETRVPYLDYQLVEFMLQVPTSLKFKHHETKYLLKKIARGLLPDIVIDRKKIGFAAPIERWFTSGSYFPTLLKNLEQNHLKQFAHPTDSLDALFVTSNAKKAVNLWVLQNLLALKA